MNTTGDEGTGKSSLPLYVDRGIGWRRAVAMLSLSLLLHATVVLLLGLIHWAPAESDAAAEGGRRGEIDIVDIESDPVVEPPVDVAVEIEPSPITEFADATPAPSPEQNEVVRPIVAKRPDRPAGAQPRGIPSGTHGPALAQVGNAPTGWSTPKPTYPFQARRLRRQGSGGIRVTTNGSGRVVDAEMLPGIDPLLDAVAVNFARSAWSGPPNRTRVIAITFALE